MTDVLAGFKAWKREVTQSFILKSNTYSYEAELPIKSLQHGWRVIDVPVTTESRKEGVSSVRVFRVGIKLIRDITGFRFSFG